MVHYNIIHKHHNIYYGTHVCRRQTDKPTYICIYEVIGLICCDHDDI